MYSVFVRFEVKPDSLDEFDALAADVIAGVRTEPGAIAYVNHTVHDSPTSRIFIETYTDQAAFDEHAVQPHTVSFLAAKDAVIDSETVIFLEDITGHYPVQA